MLRITMGGSGTKTVQEAYALFVQRCRVKNLSGRTVTDYEEKLKPFLELHGDEEVRRITRSMVEKYTLWLRKERQINDISLQSYLRPLRAFLYFCMDEEMVSRFIVRIPKADKKIKETYTDEELTALLAKPDKSKCSFTEFKIWAFENYLLATGNRLSTALNVRISDLDFENGLIVLAKAKNRKQQIIPMSTALSSVLREYLTIRGGSAEDYLFCTNYGRRAETSTYQTLVGKYNRSRGVSRTSIHTFRHTFAKHWILAGGDVFRLQKILGHSDITVTKEYVEMFAPDLQRDFDRFNPLDARSTERTKIRIKKA